MHLKGFILREEKISSWNNTYLSKANIIYPKGINELKKLISLLKKKNKKYLIRTGACSYDSKSINPSLDTIIISLSHFKKIKKINISKKIIEVEAGVLISEIIKEIKKKKLTLYSVPGGENITVGGAISANAIGKDSSAVISSFGDSLEYLVVLAKDGTVKKISKKNKLFKNYIGAFGMQGIILKSGIKVKNIKTENILLTTKIINSFNEIKNEFKKKFDYHYIQIDPFFRDKNFAISFRGNISNNNNKIYKNIDLKAHFLDKLIFKLCSFFLNYFTWKIFYKLFFYKNKNLTQEMDIHNFHYSSKYKHLVPLICRNGLIDYEILIKNNFDFVMKKIALFLKNNKIFPIYIIVKKLHKSKSKFFYQFNDNGYAVAISFDKTSINSLQLKYFKTILKKNKLKINLSKTDDIFVASKGNDNLFLSLYKKMLLKNYGISGKRA
jgi:UDP-N-acetylenolpyruvoylglucosamine reductase